MERCIASLHQDDVMVILRMVAGATCRLLNVHEHFVYLSSFRLYRAYACLRSLISLSILIVIVYDAVSSYE
jgi:hypothetical protein